jgi:hypothetical protein
MKQASAWLVAIVFAAVAVLLATHRSWAPWVDGPEMAARIDRAMAIAADRDVAEYHATVLMNARARECP